MDESRQVSQAIADMQGAIRAAKEKGFVVEEASFNGEVGENGQARVAWALNLAPGPEKPDNT